MVSIALSFVHHCSFGINEHIKITAKDINVKKTSQKRSVARYSYRNTVTPYSIEHTLCTRAFTHRKRIFFPRQVDAGTDRGVASLRQEYFYSVK